MPQSKTFLRILFRGSDWVESVVSNSTAISYSSEALQLITPYIITVVRIKKKKKNKWKAHLQSITKNNLDCNERCLEDVMRLNLLHNTFLLLDSPHVGI